jgi:hypothetical protein
MEKLEARSLSELMRMMLMLYPDRTKNAQEN